MDQTSELAAEVSIDNGPPVRGTLEIVTEMVDVTREYKTEPDMRWEYADLFDHYHAYAEDGTLPTLVAHAEHRDCDGSCGGVCEGEGYDVTVYDCAICGEAVEPATVTTTPVGREYVPGPKFWRATVAGRVEPDQKVSLRMTVGDTVYFGVGVGGGLTVESGFGRDVYSATVHGISPLGQRKVRAKAAP